MGRFITADSIVQAPYDPQSLNRYSYCRNNPINYVDPTGNFWWFIPLIIAAVKGAIAGALIGGAIAAATGGNIGQGFLTGAISGFIFGLTGSLGLPAGIPSILGHTLAGAASGTANAAVTGGDLGMGAAIGGASAGASEMLGTSFPFFNDAPGVGISAFLGNLARRAVAGAIVGGGVSAAFGGDFGRGAQSGATTSAIAYTANHAMHELEAKARDALDTDKNKPELAPSDINKNNNETCSNDKDYSKGVTAKFKWYDPTSWIFPGTNYCGITRSGPGKPTSGLDSYCQRHDECIRNAKGRWWLPSYKVLDCHDEFVNSIEGYTDSRAER